MELPAKHILSKSTFIRGCSCKKSLWLHKHRPELKDEMSEAQEQIFEQGINVGLLARKLFPDGTDVTPETPFEYQKSVYQTSQLINQGTTTIYEAAFQHNEVMVAVDILDYRDGKWFVYEVKSSASVKEPYIMDAALQYHVITNSGLPVEDFFIVHINNKYIRKGMLRLDQLFKKESVLKKILPLQKDIGIKIEELKTMCACDEMPEQEIGAHCVSPYLCDFYGHCWKDIPEDSVFELGGKGGMDRALELYRMGIIDLASVPADYKLGTAQRMHVDVHISGEPVINKTAVKNFLDQLKYPLYFLDFETYQSPVPEFDGHFAYQQLPFQFSLHVQRSQGSELEHYAHVSDPALDPCEGFIKRLLEVMGEEGSVITYNKSFESGVLDHLQRLYPDCIDQVKKIQSRMVDLMVPFRSRHVYLKEMKGSHSIKNVLPAMVPGMSYDHLAISDGRTASRAFVALKSEMDASRAETLRAQLLEYCELDTLAMVRLVDRLYDFLL